MGRSESTSSSETSSQAAASSSATATAASGAPLPTPPASFKAAAPPAAASSGTSVRTTRSGSAASLSTSSSATKLQSAVAGPGKMLYCSAECAAADSNNADLASHLSEALHLYSPTSLEAPAWHGGSNSTNGRHLHGAGSLPSPFLVSGSDSESGDYFHHHRRLQHLEHDPSVDPFKQPLGFVAHGPGVRRYSARSATTTMTTTTGSSSDSLASLWDPSVQQQQQSQASTSMSHSASSHGGLRRMTPLHALATPPLVPLSPIASVPISALSLVAPPASSPLPPSTMLHASPSMTSFDHTTGGGYSYSSSSSSLASYRSPSHPRSAVAAIATHTAGGLPCSNVSASRQPSIQGSSFSSTATFEPGSAPAAASLYASYAASFQRTPSVEARLASFGSPRRTSTASISSLRSSRLHYSVDGGVEHDDSRGRTSSGSLSSSGRLRSRSRANDAAFSEDGSADDGSGFGRGLGQSGPHHQITPTQPSLIDRARPQSNRRPSNGSNDGDSVGDGGRSAASSYAAETQLEQHQRHRAAYPHHHHRPASRSASGVTTSRKSTSPSSDREYLSMAPPQSTVRVRPPPAPSRKHHTGPVSADAGWSWGAKEKMYEIPRVTAHLDNLVREGGGSSTDPSAAPGSAQRKGSVGKLFYWGA